MFLVLSHMYRIFFDNPREFCFSLLKNCSSYKIKKDKDSEQKLYQYTVIKLCLSNSPDMPSSRPGCCLISLIQLRTTCPYIFFLLLCMERKILTRTFSNTQISVTLIVNPIYVVQSKFSFISTSNKYILGHYEKF